MARECVHGPYGIILEECAVGAFEMCCNRDGIEVQRWQSESDVGRATRLSDRRDIIFQCQWRPCLLLGLREWCTLQITMLAGYESVLSWQGMSEL